MVKIITDSTCDLSTEASLQHGIAIVPMFVEIDGVMYQDGVNLSRHDFYSNLPHYRVFPKTAAGAPGMFVDAYRAAAREGASEIISIHIARNMSGVCAAADIGAQEVAGEGIKVHVFDSGGMSLGLGLIVELAADMARSGETSADILTAIRAQSERTLTFALADSLKYLRKGGRVSAIVAGIGELLQLRLLVEFKDGLVEQRDRQRSRRAAIDSLSHAIQQHAKGHAIQHLGVMFTSGPGIQTDVTFLQQQLATVMPIERQRVAEVTPVIGAHFGPLALASVIVT